ncbi:acetylxylan esterase [Arthrobacter sp. LAPM80]|uniref:acetylxylan esterase n=1 Tax=Arthrobacter sp. LAPM80 TaxID=3141788 RepID=UPI00398A77F9
MLLEQLREHSTATVEPEDFDACWDESIVAAREFPPEASFTPVDNLLRVIDSFDVVYSGVGWDRIRGWLHMPANRAPGENLPVVVQCIGCRKARRRHSRHARSPVPAGLAAFLKRRPRKWSSTASTTMRAAKSTSGCGSYITWPICWLDNCGAMVWT